MDNNHLDNADLADKDDNLKDQSEGNKVPLWLQGIDKSEDDETIPITPSERQGSAWIREIDNKLPDSSEETDPETVEFDEVSSPEIESETDLPPVEMLDEGPPFREVPDQDIFLMNALEDSFDKKEVTENINQEDLTNLPSIDQLDSDIDEVSNSEGFIDISEAGFTKEQNAVVEIADDEPLREGDLPEWLQEMINEAEQEINQPVSETVSGNKTGGLSEPESSVLIAHEDEAIERSSQVAEEESIDTDFDIEYALSIAKDDTAPVILPAINVEEIFPSEDTNNSMEYFQSDEEIEQQMPEIASTEASEPMFVAVEASDMQTLTDGTPHDDTADKEDILYTEDDHHALIQSSGEATSQEGIEQILQVKDHLERNQINDALPIIRDLVEQSAHLEQLKDYLNDFCERNPYTGELVEILGDIALKQGKPEVALDAYTKALRKLLSRQGGVHGTG